MFVLYNILPEIILISSIIILIIFQAYSKNLDNLVRLEYTKYLVYTTLIINIIYIFIIYESNYCIYNFNELFVNDNLTLLIKFIVLISTYLVLIISKNYLKYLKINDIEYYIFILLSILGMFCLVSSNDLISLYIAIELQSLCFYTLATYQRKNLYSTEAGLKYFVLGALSSSILLFGMSIVYSFTGATNFNDLYILILNIININNIYLNVLYLLGMLFIIISLLFKLGLAPFHNWVPDTYEGSPTSVTAFFSIVPKISILSIFLKLYLLFLDSLLFTYIITTSALLSIIVGSLGALYQKKIKRLLAYSAISHMGYMLIGFLSNDFIGFSSILIYIIIYIIMNILVFSIIFNLTRLKVSKSNTKIYNHIEYIRELKGFGIHNKWIGTILGLTLFSMAGLPPLAGFFSKMYLFMNAIHNGFYFVCIVAILCSIISAVYYIRLIKLMFFENSTEIKYNDINNNKFLILFFSSLLLILLFIPNYLVELIENTINYINNIYL